MRSDSEKAHTRKGGGGGTSLEVFERNLPPRPVEADPDVEVAPPELPRRERVPWGKAHTRQSQPDYGRGFQAIVPQAKVLRSCSTGTAPPAAGPLRFGERSALLS